MADYCKDELNPDDQVSGRTSKLCEPCGKENKRTVADVFCKDCKQLQCSKCEKAHEKFDFMSGHEIVDVDQAASNVPPANEQPVLDLKGLDKCVAHGKTLKFFCVDHQLLCCSSCSIERHRKCEEVNGLTAQIANSSVDASGLISTMTELKANASSVVEHVAKTNTSMDSQIEDLPIQVDKMKVSVVKMFETLKEKVVNDAKAVAKEMADNLGKKDSTCKDIIRSLAKSIAFLQTVVAHGSPTQIYIAIHSLQKQIESHQSIIKEQHDGLQTVNFSFDYSTALMSLLQAGDTLGNLHVDKKHNGSDSDPDMKPVQMALLASVDVKQSTEDTLEPPYNGLAFLPDGRLVVIDNVNLKCFVMNEKLEKVGMYKFSRHPFGIAAISESEVAVTGGDDRNAISFLQVSASSTITLLRTIKCSSKFYSLCLMNDTTIVATTYDDRRAVRMISLTGQENDFPGLPEKTYGKAESAITCIRDANVIVISDRPEHTVTMYDVTDKCATRCVVKNEHIKDPRGVCVGPGDCIFACIGDTHSIVQLSQTGKVVSLHKLDMKYPRAVNVSPDGSKLVVSNKANGNRKIQIYSLL